MIGNTLSHYKIIDKLGQGGMGEVYLAEDSRLDRKVALKILPQHLSERAELRERFEREARAVSSLNHPHICTLYDIGEQDGIHYLVMEHLVGETLEARLAKGALPLEQTLEYAIQIADALDKAHRQGVVHRDLKPSNIMLVKSGAKLLDFGLAKLQAAETPTNLSALPTEQANLTAEGTILGTLQYMAPEQLEGKEADSRTDIFAFGAVVYEMATGKKTFEGKSQASLIAAIMEKDPPAMSEVKPMTPELLDQVVKKCLAKEPDERWQTASDLMTGLRWVIEVGTEVGQPPSVTSPALWKRAIPWSVALLMAVIAASIAFWDAPPTVSRPLTRFVITPSPSAPLANRESTDVTISPDGRRIAFVTLSEGTGQLYLRSLDTPEATAIPGTKGVEGNFLFSPDGEWVAFVSGDELKKVSLFDGTQITLCEVKSLTGGSWGPNGTIVFTGVAGDSEGLYRVSAGGGEPMLLAMPNLDEGGVRYSYPQILPGGKAVLFDIRSSEGSQIAVLSLETGEHQIISERGSKPHYVETAHLVYAQGRIVMAVPFDLERLEVTGDPVPVIQRLRSGGRDYAVSDEGTLVYIPARVLSEGDTLVWVDREGRESEPLLEKPLEYLRYVHLSPDGQRLTLTTGPDTQGDLWVHDLTGRPPYPLAFEGHNLHGVWSPDGKRVAFVTTRSGSWNLVLIPADGSTLDPEPLLMTEGTMSQGTKWPHSWSSGGELIFTERRGADAVVMALPIEETREPRQVVQTEYTFPIGEGGAAARLSPNGKWLAYMSAVTGEPEIWVRPYPGPGTPVRISPNGGLEPVWGPNGLELFYLEGDKMMAVKIETGAELHFLPPELLFEENYYRDTRPSYDVGPDGRFLTIKASGELEPHGINVVLNWFEELKRLVPTDN